MIILKTYKDNENKETRPKLKVRHRIKITLKRGRLSTDREKTSKIFVVTGIITKPNL